MPCGQAFQHLPSISAAQPTSPFSIRLRRCSLFFQKTQSRTLLPCPPCFMISSLEFCRLQRRNGMRSRFTFRAIQRRSTPEARKLSRCRFIQSPTSPITFINITQKRPLLIPQASDVDNKTWSHNRLNCKDISCHVTQLLCCVRHLVQ